MKINHYIKNKRDSSWPNLDLDLKLIEINEAMARSNGWFGEDGSVFAKNKVLCSKIRGQKCYNFMQSAQCKECVWNIYTKDKKCFVSARYKVM